MSVDGPEEVKGRGEEQSAHEQRAAHLYDLRDTGLPIPWSRTGRPDERLPRLGRSSIAFSWRNLDGEVALLCIGTP